MLRVVLDTNIVISGIFWGGLPGQALDAVSDGRAQLVLSSEIVGEILITLARDKFKKRVAATGKSVEQLLDTAVGMAEIVTPASVPENVVRDPKDRQILAAALGSEVDCIVSGDKDLLVLVQYKSIPILTGGQFLSLLE